MCPPSGALLHATQAVVNGDALTVGQAWQEVQAGAVEPDIDALNLMLKCEGPCAVFRWPPHCMRAMLAGQETLWHWCHSRNHCSMKCSGLTQDVRLHADRQVVHPGCILLRHAWLLACRARCRVSGDPSPKEAEELYAHARKRGVLPNDATYRALAAIQVRHEQLGAL